MALFSTSDESFINDRLPTTKLYDDKVKCAPRKGDWNGGDDVLMIIPKLDKRKGKWNFNNRCTNQYDLYAILDIIYRIELQ